MKKLIPIYSLIIYVFFMQIYPVVHWHAQEHNDNIELKISIHPPQLSEPVEQDDHHKHASDHDHQDVHFETDQHYTYPVNSYSTHITINTLIEFHNIDLKTQVVIRKPLDVPLKIPHACLQKITPLRAPPELS